MLVSRLKATAAGALCALAAGLGFAAGAQPSSTDPIPKFTADDGTGWVLDRANYDDLLPAGSGPAPVTFDKAHPYIPNGSKEQPTYRVADVSNPILQPWAKERMKKSNDEVLAGKMPFRARELCWPIGVPGFAVFSLVEPFYFLQKKDEVILINQGGPEIRRVRLNVPHSSNPKPSWYGESIGHYENGDTLVVDTIGVTTRTFVDNYRTPHSEQLHVVERYTLVDGGKAVEISMTIDDPGAFTTKWSARQRWVRFPETLSEIHCNENNEDFFNLFPMPSPRADKPDF
jgi:hypothetical protein